MKPTQITSLAPWIGVLVCALLFAGPAAAQTTLPVSFDTLCAGTATLNTRVEGVTYAWNTGQDTRGISVPAAGTYVATVTAADGTQTIDPREVTLITVPDPQLPRALQPGPYCAGDSVTFTVDLMGYDSIEWNNARQVVTPGFGPENRFATYAVVPGEGVSYIAYYTRCNAAVTVLPPLQFSEDDIAGTFTGALVPDNLENVCPGDVLTLSFQGEGFDSLRWEDGTTTAERQITADPASDYALTVFRSCGVDSVVFTPTISYVANEASLSVDPTMGICQGDEVSLEVRGQGVGTITWDDGTAEPSRMIAADSNQFYSAVVTTVCDDTLNLVADLRFADDCEPDECAADFPEIISPNGDGTNDLFRLFSSCEVAAYQLKIFNRWGDTVFNSDDPDTGWDGTSGGAPQNVDTYLYAATYRLRDGEAQNVTGQFVLVR